VSWPSPKNLDIEGLGANELTVSGDAASRVFDSSSGVTVTIADLPITDGLADHGGAILNEAGANLTLADVAHSNNQATGGLGGGAIFNDDGANLSISDGSLANNRATTAVCFDPSTGGGGGGGPPPSGAVALLGVGAGSAINNIDPLGGTTLTASDLTLSHNMAVGGAGNSGAILAGEGIGGGLATEVGAVAVLISNGRIDHNQAIGGDGVGGGNGSDGLGGGLANLDGCSLSVSTGSVEHNTAVGGAGAPAATSSAVASTMTAARPSAPAR